MTNVHAGCGQQPGNSRSIATAGVGKEFSPGGGGSWGIFAFLCSLEQDHHQGSPGPFWPGYCLLLMHHKDDPLCPAAGGTKAFSHLGWTSKYPWGHFAFLCSTEPSCLPGLLWAVLTRCLRLVLHEGGKVALGRHPGEDVFFAFRSPSDTRSGTRVLYTEEAPKC